jgi:hypothetical protein
MRLFVFTTIFMLVAGMAFAAGIDGKWEGEIQGMGGEPMKIGYTFKADGTTLTGTTKGMDGNDIEITDGKIEGNSFSYSVDFGMGMPMKFKGVLKGDQITLTMDMGDMGGGGPPMEPMILKRAE